MTERNRQICYDLTGQEEIVPAGWGQTLTHPTPPDHIMRQWVVTRPAGLDGREELVFEMTASSWFMAEYYGRAGWPYEHKATVDVA